ncbi:MAG: dihydrofolate reductase family protein [Desulfobacterales bacterium]|nr:dihydrofolate reductase family protein [Desulfobacterales bacterium]MCF8078177.1 dihydrofolate reductase family protein [Desulfobacterales bacterium]
MKVILVMAMTVDGMIAKSGDHFPDWTGKGDKRLFMEISKKAGAVIMGSKTYDTLKKPLPDRKTVVLTRNRQRISSDPRVVFSPLCPANLLKELAKEGYKEAILAGGATVNTLFAAAGLIDEMVLTVSPLVFGTGISLFAGEVDMSVELVEHQRLEGGLLCLRYRILSPDAAA